MLHFYRQYVPVFIMQRRKQVPRASALRGLDYWLTVAYADARSRTRLGSPTIYLNSTEQSFF